ncbi:acyl-CoA reductase [Butyrivibrio proteoclasticus]|uniref:acyl-CoA reductase n=1 Tax=Butyrivibrio proteoclasticus TaxID=43305 RepID=UPI00047E8B5E|nr:acyl-CoA reductase [Butyrivibrio proteoclasticus]
MQLNSKVLDKVTFLTGSADDVMNLPEIRALSPFDDNVMVFLNDVSRELMGNKEVKAYPDVVTFAFWIRKGSLLKLKERFKDKDQMRLGKGIAFHIAPSNVPVNFAYSLAAGLILGNANVVRVPSRDFAQVKMITDAFNKALEQHESLKSYLLCVRYERDSEINDLFCAISDMRIVWGGDQTISELRKSPLPPRSGEITFADRYSLAVIDSDSYMTIEDKARVAEDFYNDTFLTDQNACTSPRIVVWTGKQINEAKKIFWSEEHKLVEKKYTFQPIQAVNKLTQVYIASTAMNGVKVENHEDNLIVRISVSEINENLMDYRDNSGYFYEYDCKDIMELISLCNDKRCQTIGYIGDRNMFVPLILSGVKGIDRVVPVGKTMDFDLIWDGYNLPAMLTRTVAMV